MAADLKISYQSKESYTCPACKTEFHREELLSGSGRLIAGELTDELHRLYEPSAKYGEIYPLVYQATVCPNCWYSSMDRDFDALPGEAAGKVLDDTAKRKEDTLRIFPGTDFSLPRGLINGAASLYLAARCYEFFGRDFSPTIKQGVAILRCAWLLDELDKKYPGQHFDWIAVLFKKKAQFFYAESLKKEQSGKETLSAVKNFGPDTDKNYSYEGALYLSGLLKFRYGPKENPDERKEALEDVKRTIAKIFGIGKSSKNKPGPLLEHGKNLYDAINRELEIADDQA